jgi:CheY-like chemotaxis protein
MTTVLIVDDSKLARIVVRKALSELKPDWKCVEASSADEAMVIVGFQAIDVAFIDYNMPGKNGLELLAEIRALHINIPIAVITANVQRAIINRTRARLVQPLSRSPSLLQLSRPLSGLFSQRYTSRCREGSRHADRSSGCGDHRPSPAAPPRSAARLLCLATTGWRELVVGSVLVRQESKRY